jgi:hypothetical protein
MCLSAVIIFARHKSTPLAKRKRSNVEARISQAEFASEKNRNAPQVEATRCF